MRWNRFRMVAALLAIACAGQPVLDYAWGCRWLRARRSYRCCYVCDPCQPANCGSSGSSHAGVGSTGSSNNNSANGGSIYDLPEVAQIPAEVPELMIPPEVQAMLDQEAPGATSTGVSLAIKSQTGVRNWTLRDGRTTTALLRDVTDNTLLLEKDGRQYRVPVEQLCEEDQQFVESQYLRTAAVPVRNQGVRVWTHRDGRTLQAKLLEVLPERVRLEKGNRVWNVARQDLSEADQAYLQSLDSVAGVFDRVLR